MSRSNHPRRQRRFSKRARANGIRGSWADVNGRVKHNDASMRNNLMSSSVAVMFDHCCGIHGAMRERASAKRATSAARRRHEKEIIQRELEEHEVR